MHQRKDPAKQQLFEQFARIGKALSNANRLELLDLLAQGEKPVELLSRQSGLSVTNTSNHLKELRLAGLVTSRRDGAWIHYRLSDDTVHGLLRSLQEVARGRLAEVRQIVSSYYESRDGLEPVGIEELLERLRSDDVVVLDVRPEDEYRSGHIPGALSIPVGELEARLSELEARVSELPPGGGVVAYCRGPYCVFSLQALEILRSRGIPARRLEEGLPDWRSRGLEVAQSNH